YTTRFRSPAQLGCGDLISGPAVGVGDHGQRGGDHGVERVGGDVSLGGAGDDVHEVSGLPRAERLAAGEVGLGGLHQVGRRLEVGRQVVERVGAGAGQDGREVGAQAAEVAHANGPGR